MLLAGTLVTRVTFRGAGAGAGAVLGRARPFAPAGLAFLRAAPAPGDDPDEDACVGGSGCWSAKRSVWCDTRLERLGAGVAAPSAAAVVILLIRSGSTVAGVADVGCVAGVAGVDGVAAPARLIFRRSEGAGDAFAVACVAGAGAFAGDVAGPAGPFSHGTVVRRTRHGARTAVAVVVAADAAVTSLFSS